MSDINDSGPAFPILAEQAADGWAHCGVTLRQYAAIKLKVPDSGIDWLNEMIAKSRRLDALEAIAPAIVAKMTNYDPIFDPNTHVSIAKISHKIYAALRDFKA